MDVDYIYDTYDKQHKLHMSGEHFAVANFLNTEFSPKRYEVDKINALIEKIESGAKALNFAEWSLTIEADEAVLKHNSNEQKVDYKEESLSLMEWEHEAEFSVCDLISLLVGWVDFIETT